MFSKISRYRKLPDIVAPDADGRLLPSRQLRLLPPVTGSFTRIVTSNDRLDALAAQYYDQPLLWWNIADGNSSFLSPLTLLGQDAVHTTRFPVIPAGAPAWSTLLPALRALLGVESVVVEQDAQLVKQSIGGGVTGFVEQISWVVVVTYNSVNVSAEALSAAIQAQGFQVLPAIEVNQVGQEITIPPQPGG